MTCTRLPKQRIHRRRRGYTVIELVTALGIVSVLLVLALPRATAWTAKAKRTEAHSMLSSIVRAQLVYYGDYAVYSPTFQDLMIGFSARRLVDGSLQGKAYNFVLTNPGGAATFQVTATGNIDSDSFLDIVIARNP
jgi:prepilin-type N-terminal cleavage/methylation domain-containing protein